MTDFTKYMSEGCYTSAGYQGQMIPRKSIYHGVPIQYLDEFRALCRSLGFKFKIRYRGPNRRKLCYGRTTYYITCLKSQAKTFTAYPENSYEYWSKNAGY